MIAAVVDRHRAGDFHAGTAAQRAVRTGAADETAAVLTVERRPKMPASQRAGEDSMTKAATRQSKRALTALSVLMTTLLSAACGVINPNYVLPNICRVFDDTPLTPLSAPPPNDPTNPKLIFETLGRIKVMHGSGTAKLESGNRVIKVEQSVAIPTYANQATVFLNGWNLSYLGGDQHVLALGALITKIRLDRRGPTLTWTAAGVLRDDDFKEGYNFTYHFTVIAWNDTALSRRPAVRGEHRFPIDPGAPATPCTGRTATEITNVKPAA